VPQPLSVSLIVPTFNEAENIEELLHRAHRTIAALTSQFEILVVDDSSTDSTVALARAVAVTYPRVQVIERQGKRDLACSVMDGWNASTGEVLAVIDADLQHPPEMLSSLLNLIAATGADVGVASRHIPGGGVSDWKLHRRIVSWCATVMAGFLIPGVLRMVRDPMSGFFAVRNRVVAGGLFRPTGYKILLEVLARAQYESVVEVPYVFEERKRGASKLGAKQVRQYLHHLARLSLETGEAQLLARYIAVGASGIAVNALISQVIGGPWGQGAGFEVSVLSNFLLNEHWTFRGKSRHLAMKQPVLGRLGSFQLISLASLVLNLGLSAVLANVLNISAQTASLSGIVAAGLTNFFANAHLTWSFWKEEDIHRPGGAVERHKHSAR
jgi:dolichol-phosphate mannosyltransferase